MSWGGAFAIVGLLVGSGGTDSGSTTSSSTSTSTSTTGEESTEGGDTCGRCGPNSGDGGIVFGNLGDGTPPAGETVIEVWAIAKCSCDDCGCYDDDASMIRLELDSEPVGAPCSGMQCEFTVVLTPGTHVIAAIATYDAGEISSAVQIEVPGEGGTSESGGGAANDVDHDSSGCGCASDRASPPLGLLVFATALSLRRRCTRALASTRGRA